MSSVGICGSPIAFCAWTLCFGVAMCAVHASALADDLSALRAEQDKKYAAALERLAGLCEKYGLVEQAKYTRNWRVKRDPAKIYVFEHTDAFVPDELAKTTTEQQRVWLNEFTKYRKAQARWLYQHAKAAAEARQVGLALELIYETLREDPDHGEARRILGYERLDDRWVTAFEAKQARRGLVWHDEFGWIARADVPRYEKGERRDGVRWMSAAEDARRRATIERGWTIDTAHFRVTTNHSLSEGVRLGRKLEQLYHVWRQLFAGYLHSPTQAESWFRSGKVKEPKRQFDVFYFRTRDDYNEYLKRWEPRIAMTLGFYSDRQRKSYFFAGEDQDPATVFHEATHQLFSESRATRKDCGENAHFWVIEGIACYMESLAAGDGYWTVGGADAGRTPAARIRLLRDSFYLPFEKLTAMGRAQLQTNPEIRKIYSQISGQSAFLMHADNGRYRDALVDYLLEIYTTARLPAKLLEKLTKKTNAELDAAYRVFMQESD
ncbi:MAG: DUF1570 domain-containing protein [Pirellulales bacterium]|nr:DUF1570 domain-containing protein [Pirellulales bacterium]